jgi:sugar phosphate permease
MARFTLFPGWKVVAGSAVGISFGSVPMFASGFGLLAASMAKQFGWNQPQVQLAATIFLLLQTIAYPICGFPLDRFGSRKFAVASIAAFAITLAILSQIGDSLTGFYTGFALIGILTAGTNVLPYARAIALWFNRRRGIALGIAASSQAVGSFLIPNLAQRTIARFGWSGALLALAAFEVVVCLSLVALLVKDSPAQYGLEPDGGASSNASSEPSVALPPQKSLGEMVRTVTFWKLAISFAAMGMTFYAIAPNIVYILVKSAGMTPAQIAQVLTASGIAVLFGRIVIGYLLDKIHAPVVGALTLILTACSAATYAVTANPIFITLAATAGGFAIGGETDLMPYLASRYFGARAVPKIFGWFLFAFFMGATVAPISFAKLSVAYGGASTPLFMLVGLQIVPLALFLSLGRYPDTKDVR